MGSFFEKLKKGMGIEFSAEEETPQKPASSIEEKPKEVKRKKRPKKLEVQVKPLEPPSPEEKVREKEIKEPALVISEPEPISTTKEVAKEKEKWFELEGQLAIDVYQTETELIIQSAIAGIKSENLDISIEEDQVLIRGKREMPPEKGERNYFYQECYWGPFSRQIILPVETDPSRAQASMKEGILTIRIPKIERQKKRKIMIEG